MRASWILRARFGSRAGARASTIALLAPLVASCAAHTSASAHVGVHAAVSPVSTTYFPLCSPAQKPWLLATPAEDREFFYGVGAAAVETAALDVARAEAAKSISVEIREQMTDTQTLWIDHAANAVRSSSQDQIERAASSFVARRVEGCNVRDKCRDDQSAVHVLLECPRQAALERQLTAAAAKLAANWPGPGSVLAIPGTDAQGYVTQLGEYAAQVLRDSFGSANAIRPGVHLVVAPPWKPTDLHQAARDAGASHLLRLEYLALQDLQLRFSVYLQDAATDYHVPGTDMGFDVELEPEQAALLSIQGPLLPQKDAEALVNASGSFPVPLRLSKTLLREGETLTIQVTPPRDGYLYLYDIYEDGRAALLLPNPMSPNNQVRGGTTVEIPDATWQRAGASLVACPLRRQSVTREYVKVITSPVPLDLPGTRVSGTDFTTLAATGGSADIAAIRARLVELKNGSVPFGTAEIPYFIQAAEQPLAACASAQ